MSDFVWILLAGGFSAYAFSAVMGQPQAWWSKALSVLLYLLVGMHTVLLVWWTGDGRIFPGWQVNPEVRNYFQAVHERGGVPQPDAAFAFVALAAHLLAMLPRTTRGTFWRPLPATLFFLATFFVFGEQGDPPTIEHLRARGPAENGYLTIVPERAGEGPTTLVFARGSEDAAFVRVLRVHDSAVRPPRPGLIWTEDGRYLVFGSRYQRIFALERHGESVGLLPVEAHEWPAAPRHTESAPVQRRLSEARRAVDLLVKEHGGYFIP